MTTVARSRSGGSSWTVGPRGVSALARERQREMHGFADARLGVALVKSTMPRIRSQARCSCRAGGASRHMVPDPRARD